MTLDELSRQIASMQSEIEAMEQCLAQDGVVTPGSVGQPTASPLLSALRAHRKALRELLNERETATYIAMVASSGRVNQRQ